MLRDGLCDSDEWVLFSLNNFWGSSVDSEKRLRADIWWEFHQIHPDIIGPENGRQIQDRYDMEWIRTCPVPIYTVEPFPENPNAVVWPVEYYVDRCGGRRYIACTFAAQLMTLFVEGFTEIAVYGLELLNGTKREATIEASCVAYWLGYLEGKGVRIRVGTRVDGESQLLLTHPYVYGVEYWRERRWVEGYVASFDYRPVAV